MNVGWGWGMADPAGIGGTVVANNSIASFCQRLNDCGEPRSSRVRAHLIVVLLTPRSSSGGIYTLGAQPGNVLSGNHIAGDPWKRQKWPLTNDQGIYHDGGSRFFT